MSVLCSRREANVAARKSETHCNSRAAGLVKDNFAYSQRKQVLMRVKSSTWLNILKHHYPDFVHWDVDSTLGHEHAPPISLYMTYSIREASDARCALPIPNSLAPSSAISLLDVPQPTCFNHCIGHARRKDADRMNFPHRFWTSNLHTIRCLPVVAH
jgi:hypothetical protein